MNPLDLVFGQKPEVAKYTPTDFSQEQIDNLLANIQAFPDITKLGDLYQQYMLDQFDQAGVPLKELLGQGVGLTKQEMGQAQQELAGQIPQDVQDALQRSSAFQNLLAGGGGAMASANTARNYGLTSLDMINRGAALAGEAGNAVQRWEGIASGTMMNTAGQMVTPQQRAALDMQNRLYQQATKQLGFNIAAMPDPAAAGISGTIMNLLGAYLGHGMGGGGGSITPSYQSMGYGGAGQGMSFGGTNQYAATTGGFNFGGSNFGGSNIPYMGGGPSDVTTPGYYMTDTGYTGA